MNRAAPHSALYVVLPIPPPDNGCHRSGPLGRYPTARYREWLDTCEPILAETLAFHTTDTENWWEIRLLYYMAARGDMPNREKAVLDLLAGSVVRKGRIEKSGRGLFDDDRRVKRVVKEWVQIGTPVKDNYVWVEWSMTAPPEKWRKPPRQKAQKGHSEPRTTQGGFCQTSCITSRSTTQTLRSVTGRQEE